MQVWKLMQIRCQEKGKYYPADISRFHCRKRTTVSWLSVYFIYT